jgi:hypothetical protein
VTALARPRSNSTINYRTVLSSERVSHLKKPAIVRRKTNIWSWVPDGSPTPRLTGRLIVSCKLTLSSTSEFNSLQVITCQTFCVRVCSLNCVQGIGYLEIYSWFACSLQVNANITPWHLTMMTPQVYHFTLSSH